MKRRILIAVPVLCCLPLLFVFAQSRAAYEVASVKQVDTTLPNSIRGTACHGVDGPQGHPLMQAGLGRCRFVGLSLKMLIVTAYGTVEERISGGPEWVNSLPYTIDAKAEDPPAYTRLQLMQMLQPLLEDRFKLKFHRETREVTGYLLVVGRDGPKLKEVNPNEPRRAPVPLAPPVPGTNTATATSAAAIASIVARALGVPVTDNTGLTGRYDNTLKWAPGESERGYDATAVASAPSIFTALQEQLGLRLEPRKTTIEVMVIDSVEKPFQN